MSLPHRYFVPLSVAALSLLLGCSAPAAAQPSAPLAQKSADAGELAERAQQNGNVRVIVLVEIPVPPSAVRPDPASLATVRAAVAAAQDGLIATHFGASAQGFDRGLVRFDITPGLAVNVTADELDALAADPRVTTMQYDRPEPPALIQSVPLVGMTTAYAAGATGAGQAVAVLDTGTMSNHEFLSGKVIAEACRSFAGGAGGAGRVTLCPNAAATQNGAGAADANTAQCLNGGSHLCTHGSHVAGIAAGLNTNQQGGEPTNGVGRNAAVFSIQVFTRFNNAGDCAPSAAPCVLAFNSDQIAALDHVFANLTLAGGVKVASVNMSLGGGNFAGTCDGDARKPIIDSLRAAGVLTAIASGNNGFTAAIGAPGCISTAVTVGSTTKADVISSFSNSSAVVDLLAPGSSILSSIPIVPTSNTTTYSSFNGTSMATPHVAGAIAAIRTACPMATANAIETALKNTGTPVTDTRPGGTQTKPRIRVDLALQSLNCGGGGGGPAGPLACASSTQLGDFNADNRRDLVFRRNDGLTSVYFMNGTQVASAGIVGQIGSEFTLVGIGDFNGDGRADLLMRRTDGTMAMFLMNGASVVAAQLIGNIGNEWKVMGVGDFNGDGRADFLTRRPDGLLAVYLMNGFQFVGAQVIGQIGTEWTVAQVADFDGNGRADFLTRRGDGTVAIYLMAPNGLSVAGATIVGNIGNEWRLIAAGDFNGDARADFLTRKNDGTLAIYLANGTQITGAQIIGNIGTEWKFVGIGDLNADGRSDLVFRRGDGTLSAYLISGFQILSGQIAGNVGPEWDSCYGQGLGGLARVSQR